jgi:hypothetical protein
MRRGATACRPSRSSRSGRRSICSPQTSEVDVGPTGGR